MEIKNFPDLQEFSSFGYCSFHFPKGDETLVTFLWQAYTRRGVHAQMTVMVWELGSGQPKLCNQGQISTVVAAHPRTIISQSLLSQLEILRGLYPAIGLFRLSSSTLKKCVSLGTNPPNLMRVRYTPKYLKMHIGLAISALWARRFISRSSPCCHLCRNVLSLKRYFRRLSEYTPSV